MSFLKTLLLPIIAWMLITTGLLMLIWPEMARKKIIASGGKLLTNWLIILFVMLLPLLWSFSNRISPMIILSAIAGLLFLAWTARKTAIEKMTVLSKTLSVQKLRLFASGQILVGILMLVLKRTLF